MSEDNDPKIISFKALRKKSGTFSMPEVSEYGELKIDKEPLVSNKLSGIQRFFYTMVVLLIVLAVLLTAFY